MNRDTNLKHTGVVRRIDDLGRIVLPKELRRMLDIAERDPLEIHVRGDMIMLRKYAPHCILCGNEEGITTFKDRQVCAACIADISAG